jgi:site-specific DNA-cytosine methylase
LDLFCGAGGAAMGYWRAGFDVVGVDIEDHPSYPFELIVADAMEVLADPASLVGFDVVHADMGIDWMTWDDLREAIPHAYTEYIGAQLIAALAVEAS